ncbi:hypothetical protein A2881_04330 [Candidatus Peribacteria bacterium RIFCSPHIGHO2_01_FULL_55_13]|nr:MAG: hypothetical protein A2881_04330 [Candidatus Peribacteria bacterium RIFCSPHIGHO2_01_FULL_55_13]OGJ65048.1 MAG: hypothetical protein A3F36_01190 [Candidatus Peribacteria bacterium RIFCSPHIGHO2_12_FULL_55_11]
MTDGYEYPLIGDEDPDVSERMSRIASERPSPQAEVKYRYRFAQLLQRGLLPDDQAIKIMQELDRESEGRAALRFQ